MIAPRGFALRDDAVCQDEIGNGEAERPERQADGGRARPQEGQRGSQRQHAEQENRVNAERHAFFPKRGDRFPIICEQKQIEQRPERDAPRRGLRLQQQMDDEQNMRREEGEYARHKMQAYQHV